MASSTITNSTTIPTPPDSTIYAEMRYGSNGSDGGPPELFIGKNGSSTNSGRVTWDNTDDAFDTGNVSIAIDVPAGGGSLHPDTLAVAGAVANPILYTSAAYGFISTVVVIAGVQTNAAVAISGLSVQFYNNGILRETFNLASGPAVDTLAASIPVAIQTLTITPAQSNHDMVLVTATLRMQAPDGAFPDVDDLFAQVFVQTQSPVLNLGTTAPAPGLPVNELEEGG